MPKTSDELIAIDVRNQVLLERLKVGEHKKFAPYLKRIERDVRIRMSDEGETIATKKALNVLLTDVQRIQKEIYDEYILQLTGDLGDIAIQQSTFEAKSYEKVVVDFESKIPAPAQVLAAVRINPMQISNYAGDPLVEPFIRDWSKKETARVTSTIQQGFYQGQTNQQIVTAIRGTKANNFKDGILDISNRSAKTTVRTVVQHASSQARQATMNANNDLIKGYEWVSTLDSKTSQTCQSLDGRKFNLGEGPLPPIHPNCRSVTTPVLSDKFDFLDEGAKRASKGAKGGAQVSADQTYYSWLKTQPKTFQDTAIGPTRSKLLRNGGLSSEEFARLSLNKNFQPLTLKEFEKVAPLAFEKAGL
jgi:SPP1 gp7 family putative phage head morphogenesis protein